MSKAVSGTPWLSQSTLYSLRNSKHWRHTKVTSKWSYSLQMNYVKSIETEESVQEGHQQIHCRSSNEIILKL